MAQPCPPPSPGLCIPPTEKAFPHRGSEDRAPAYRALPRALISLLLTGALLWFPKPAAAQFGALEALASNVTDLSFFGGIGGLAPGVNAMDSGKRTFAFGVELLFQIASVEKPVAGATQPPVTDSVSLTWTRMEVVRSEEGVDSVYYYDVESKPPPPLPTEEIWTVELGIGYGQISGFGLADRSLEFRGSIRDLPAASVYASYEPWSTYFGIRTGFMRTKGLQVYQKDSGESFGGNAEAFLAAALAGYSWSLGDFWAFTEAAYTVRYFPSVEWQGGPLPSGIPTDLQVSGWSVTTGIQFPIR